MMSVQSANLYPQTSQTESHSSAKPFKKSPFTPMSCPFLCAVLHPAHSANKSRNFAINGRTFREIYRLFMTFFSHLAFTAVIFASRIYPSLGVGKQFYDRGTNPSQLLPFLLSTSIKDEKTRKTAPKKLQTLRYVQTCPFLLRLKRR